MISIAQTVAELRATYATPLRHGWDFDGFRVWVESNSERLMAELASYFVDFRSLDSTAAGPATTITAIDVPVAPDLTGSRQLTIGELKPGAGGSPRGPKEGWLDLPDGRVVAKLRTGMRFVFGAEHHLAIGPCVANPNQVVNFVNNRMIQWALHRGALLGHASAVGHRFSPDARPDAIAIAGFSGMGKSTLALRLMNDRRLDFISNDRVMLHPGALEGVPKHPRINPGTILNNPDLAGVLDSEQRARFAALSSDELWQLEHKFDGLIGRCFPSQKFLLAGRLAGLVLLNWTRAGSTTQGRRIELRDRTELLPALIKEPGVFYRPGPVDRPRDIPAYLALLDGVPVLELSGKIDFDYGCAAALDLLGLTG